MAETLKKVGLFQRDLSVKNIVYCASVIIPCPESEKVWFVVEGKESDLGKYDLPGGQCERDSMSKQYESYEDAALREVLEEVSMHVELDYHLGLYYRVNRWGTRVAKKVFVAKPQEYFENSEYLDSLAMRALNLDEVVGQEIIRLNQRKQNRIRLINLRIKDRNINSREKGYSAKSYLDGGLKSNDLVCILNDYRMGRKFKLGETFSPNMDQEIPTELSIGYGRE